MPLRVLHTLSRHQRLPASRRHSRCAVQKRPDHRPARSNATQSPEQQSSSSNDASDDAEPQQGQPGPSALFNTGKSSRAARTGARNTTMQGKVESRAEQPLRPPGDDGQRRAQRKEFALWLAGKTESAQFVALEAVLALAFLGLLDGGFSGAPSSTFS